MACSRFSWDPYRFLPYCLAAAGLLLLCALPTMRSTTQQAPQQAFPILGNVPSCLLPKAVKRLIVYFQGCPRSSYQYRASSLSKMKHDLGFASGVARLLTSTRSLIVVANIPNSSTIHHIALFLIFVRHGCALCSAVLKSWENCHLYKWNLDRYRVFKHTKVVYSMTNTTTEKTSTAMGWEIRSHEKRRPCISHLAIFTTNGTNEPRYI
jgi:hypothetical protein